MALTATQRAQVRLYCGWTARFRQTDSRLEQSMNALDAGDAETITVAAGMLVSLVDIDTKLVDAHKRIKANTVGSIKLTEEKEIGILRSEGRRFAGRLASLLGVEVRHDVFSGNGPSWWSGTNGPTGGGNLPPRG